jgi:hypothetical protein
VKTVEVNNVTESVAMKQPPFLFCQLARIWRVAKRTFLSLLRHAYAILQAPTILLDLQESSTIGVHEFVAGSLTYQAIRADKAKIFTNRRDNIAIIQGRSLVPHVFLQHNMGKLLPDADNFVLRRRLLLCLPPAHFQGTVLSLLSGEPANYNYYHWFFDCLPRLVIARSFAEQESSLRYFIPGDAYSFQRESLDHLGITNDRRISSADVPFLSADRIIATSPPNPYPEDFPGWALSFVRESFLPLVAFADHPSLLYISRNDSSNSRRLLNEIELWQPLSHLGFVKVQLSGLSLREQISLFANAKMIVSVHGAGLANLAFASQGTLVYEIFAENFQPQMYRRISELLHLRYQSIICSTDDQVPQVANLTISQEAIDSILADGRLADHAAKPS